MKQEDYGLQEKITEEHGCRQPFVRGRALVLCIAVALLMTQGFLGSVGIPFLGGNKPIRLSSPEEQPPLYVGEGEHLVIDKENNHRVEKCEGEHRDTNQEYSHQVGEIQKAPDVVVESDESVARRKALKADMDKGLLILVNKQNALDRDYKPEDLTDIKYFVSNRTAAGRFMRAEATGAFHRLSEAAAQEGHEILVTTAYRSADFQATLYNNYVANHGQAEADTFSAQPGKSEHQTGLAADVSSPSVEYQLTENYIKTDEGKWLNDNAYRFGFIIRFPKGKEEITGYTYEPWHIRYVGKTAAEEIFNKGLTLEEYLQD